jgi:hypothetical protein
MVRARGYEFPRRGAGRRLFFELAVLGLDRTKARKVDTTSPVAIIGDRADPSRCVTAGGPNTRASVAKFEPTEPIA